MVIATCTYSETFIGLKRIFEAIVRFSLKNANQGKSVDSEPTQRWTACSLKKFLTKFELQAFKLN